MSKPEKDRATVQIPRHRIKREVYEKLEELHRLLSEENPGISISFVDAIRNATAVGVEVELEKRRGRER